MTKTFVSFLAIAVTTPAFSQSNPGQPTTDAKGDTIVVTASRSGDATPIDLIGSSVTVVNDQTMQDRQVRVVSDVLRDVPGLAVSRLGAVGSQTQVRIRGAEGNHTLVLIDGIKASDPYAGEYDFGTLVADENAKIEVLRGQQSALYGSDAIGGVINYITLTGAEAPGFKLRAEGGSMNTFSGGARAAGVSGNLDYALSSSYIHTDGYPVAVGGTRDVGSDNLGASGKLIWTAAPNFHVTAVGRYSYTNADTDDTNNAYGTPGYGLIVDSPGVHFVNKGLYGLLRGQLDLLEGRWTNALSGQIADTKRTGYDSTSIGAPVVAASGDHGRRVKGSFESAFRFGSDAVQQRVTFALDAERESERTTVSQYGAFLGWRHTTNIGAVGEYDLTVDDRYALGASVRHDGNSRFADDTTFRVQGSAKLSAGTRLHAAYGTGIKAPSFSELFDYYVGRYIGNASLKPEKSKGYEAGVEQSFLDRRIVLDATWFDNRLTDEIATAYDAFFVAHPYNRTDRTKQQGIELSAAAKIGAGWRLDASYTYLHAPQKVAVTTNPATFATGTFDGQAVRRAKTIASANLTWAPEGQRFSGTLTVRYNGRQNDVFYGYFPPLLINERSFTLVNLNASYKLTKSIELFARVENLLDRNYFEVYSYATPGRAGYGGARVRF
ncbi:vitamin B12 transporter [Sphingomonas vulcanisoli]|uniref:Vitamin B12 transporter n=1 Tax=Sphingomonas vulcanisoli TaxID=1658060 RepID=A0ABX0TVX1_9SPHN|nr:TonB-dependent receptor [Sphingomonas vulcanisoli]NIJ08585.1 vitamin B12 transporter [Sphingomonas vulcanisoli]